MRYRDGYVEWLRVSPTVIPWYYHGNTTMVFWGQYFYHSIIPLCYSRKDSGRFAPLDTQCLRPSGAIAKGLPPNTAPGPPTHKSGPASTMFDAVSALYCVVLVNPRNTQPILRRCSPREGVWLPTPWIFALDSE